MKFLLLYGILLLVTTLKLGVYTNTIRLSPSQVNVVENTSVTLTCSKKNGQLSETAWKNSQIENQIANLYFYDGKCITTHFLQNSQLFDGICNSDGTYSVLLKRVDRTQHGAIWQCKEVVLESNSITISVTEPDIGDVLQRIGNGEFVEVFKAQNVTIDQVEYMTEEDFKRLGIETIGMRLKIKQACRNFLKGITLKDIFLCRLFSLALEQDPSI